MTHHPPLSRLAEDQPGESHAERVGESGRSRPRQVTVVIDHDVRFRISKDAMGVAAYCKPCEWRVYIGNEHTLADLINLYAQHAGAKAAEELCIGTLARIGVWGHERDDRIVNPTTHALEHLPAVTS